MKSFFITGAAGFIGSHICEHISLNFPKAKIYALDKLTYAGNKKFLSKLLKNKKLNAKILAQKLANRGIETRPLFLGMHQQPVLKKMKLFNNEKFPITEELSKFGLYLPSGLKLNKKKIDFICNALKDIFHESRK